MSDSLEQRILDAIEELRTENWKSVEGLNRMNAAKAVLAEIGAPSVAYLVAAIFDRKYDCIQICDALSKIGEPAVAAMIGAVPALKDYASCREWLLRALG